MLRSGERTEQAIAGGADPRHQLIHRAPLIRWSPALCAGAEDRLLPPDGELLIAPELDP